MATGAGMVGRMTNLGEKLVRLREAAGLTQREVSAKTGIFQPKLSNWESGNVPKRGAVPTPREWVALARLFGVTVDYLCDNDYDDPGEVFARFRPAGGDAPPAPGDPM